MKITYEVPPELKDYFEFIPEDKLCEIITKCLKDKVQSKEESEDDNSVLLGKLKDIISATMSSISEPNQRIKAKKEEKPKPVRKAIPKQKEKTVDTGEEEETASHVNDFLANIMK